MPRSSSAHTLSLVCAFACASCTVGPDFHTPDAPAADRYTREALPALTQAASGAAGTSQTLTETSYALPVWWTRFESDALARLVDHALAHNLTLLQAKARLTEARENYGAVAGSTEWPAIDASIEASRQKVDLASFGIPNAFNPGPFSLLNASVSVSYVFDLFGGNRRALEASLAQVDYASYELDAARLSIAGNVVSTAVRRASLREQITLTRDLAAIETRQIDISQARFAAGGISHLDVRSQRTTLEQTRASLAALEAQQSQVDHALATLVGLSPSGAPADGHGTQTSASSDGVDMDAITLETLTLPDTIPITLPSTLARQRPDIRAAEALLHQASAQVGVATANLYPHFAVSAGIGSERSNVQDIVNGLNIWNIGLNVTQPLFRGGELRARQRSAQAEYDAALASYQATVLEALQQVADALTALHSDARALNAREQAAYEARESLETARAQYAAGGISEYAMLDMQRQSIQTTLDRTRAQADRLADTAALFQSLGGMDTHTSTQ